MAFGNGLKLCFRRSSTMTCFFLFETTSSFLMIMVTNLAWLDSFSNWSVSVLVRFSLRLT